ncbi:MAG: osmoprotectant transport system substrate-binding protein [Actinomycetota bacterium]|jgi:osmoprotectant transport system substrate-binding protein|nr:osmoprotectant transport system substrate-binding protein [Actinomycetota bacterium]
MRLGYGKSRHATRLLGVVAVLAMFAAACGSDSKDTTSSGGTATTEAGVLSGSSFKVGSKEFTEQLILGQITILVLKDAGASVSDETGLVGSNTVRQALISGDIDMYWEYTGTGWINHLGNTAPVKGEREQFDAVAKADLDKNGVTWLEPAPFNNTYSLATSSENATALAVSKLSDLAPLQQKNPNDFTLCAAAEFLARDDGLPGLEKAYGFSFGNKVSELELGLVYASVDKGDPCKFGEVFATDGRIAALGLKVLDDDKQFFASYLPSLNVRKGVDKIPQLKELFAPVAAALDTATMQELNSKVDVDGQQPDQVARAFLTEKKLIGS